LPLLYLDKPLGELRTATRRANEALSGADVGLLRDVAQQIGIALHATQLAAELQASRERLVLAREEERRRIRNDLHDGLAPTLSSMQMQLGAIRSLIQQNPAQAEVITNDLRDDLRQATAEIRQLVYDLRPPMLDELGLVGAIRNFRVTGPEIRFEVIAPDPMPALPAAVEVAVYRIASEAVHNVVKHAQATACVVCLEVAEGRLSLSVTDNGQGVPAKLEAGVGLHSMKERAAEVGGTFSIQPGPEGGLRVAATLPLPG
jgi:signal transduction histidine kinase